MNDKEKLIDILMSKPYGQSTYEEMADYLISNGVTVQKHGQWEPVDEGETSCDEWDCTACGQRRTFLCEMDADDMEEYYPYCPIFAPQRWRCEMTAKELHAQEIIPLRKKLQKLEDEYKKLYRKECGEKVGEHASCKNCAYSCVLDITEHNSCMYGKCTCCHDWCYGWMPENEVSAFLRMNYHYEEDVFYGLANIFGDDFLKKADVNTVLEMLKLRAKIDLKNNE